MNNQFFSKLIAIGSLLLLCGTSFSATVYTQTMQGTYTSNVLFGSRMNTVTNLVTGQHTVTSGADFSNQSFLNTFDAVWVDQELGNTLSGTEVSSLNGYISNGGRAVLIGENSGWTNWNNTLMAVVGGTANHQCSYDIGTPLVSNSLTAGVSSVQNVCGSTISSGGTQLFSNDFASLFSIGLGEALVILDSNWFDDSYINSQDNLRFTENIVSWLGEDSPAVVPVPAAVWLFGSAIAGFAGFNRFKKKA